MYHKAKSCDNRMSHQVPIHILALLEANYVTGAAKGVIEFARQANLTRSSSTPVSVTVVPFRRGRESINEQLTTALRAYDIKYRTIVENSTVDFRILAQLRDLVDELRPNVIWTNSVKSHFLVASMGLALRIPWVAFHHGYTKTSFRTLIYNQLDRWSLPKAKCVLTVCKPFADQLISRGILSGANKNTGYAYPL